MTRPGPPSPIEARWSKSQTWSKPPSSAMRQTARSASMVVSWPEFLSPNRSGCCMRCTLLTSVKLGRSHADRNSIFGREGLPCPAVAPDAAGVLAHVGGHLESGGLPLQHLGLALDAYDVASVW